MLRVIYRDDGSIISLGWVSDPEAGGPLTVVEPEPGQRVAVLEVDQAWRHRSLVELHRTLVVEEGPEGLRLCPLDDAAP